MRINALLLCALVSASCANLDQFLIEQTPEWRCEQGGEADTCDWLGWAVQNGERTSTKSAVAWFELGCDRGNSKSCNSAGWHHHKGLSGDADQERASHYFGKGCPDTAADDGSLDDGARYACGNLGFQYEKGLGVERDYARAMLFYNKSCTAKMPASCFSAGIGYERGRGVEKDTVKARALYEYACQNGQDSACGNLALMLLDGQGGPFDLARAHVMLTEQCDKNNPWSCTNLGYAYANGVGVKVDSCRARTFHEKACAVGEHDLGCANLGANLVSTSCMPNDPQRGRPLVERACREHRYACGALGELLRKENDKAGAIAAYRSGCDADDSHSCLLLGMALRDGDGVMKNQAEALVHLRASCMRGRPDGCKQALPLAKALRDDSEGLMRERACALGVGDRC